MRIWYLQFSGLLHYASKGADLERNPVKLDGLSVTVEGKATLGLTGDRGCYPYPPLTDGTVLPVEVWETCRARLSTATVMICGSIRRALGF